MLRGPIHLTKSSGSVQAWKTRSRGASNSRTIRITGRSGIASTVVWFFDVVLMITPRSSSVSASTASSR